MSEVTHSAEGDAHARGINDGIRLAAQLVRDHMLSDTGERVARFLEGRADRVTPPGLIESQVCTCGAWDDRTLAHSPDCATYTRPIPPEQSQP